MDAPANVSGTALLSATAKSGGARLECRITVHVRVPLIGGKLENLVGTQLADLVVAEQRFTTEVDCQTTPNPHRQHWLPKLAPMRIALAQILSGTDPAQNLQLVREYAGRAADAGLLEAGGVPRGDHVPVRRPAGTDRRARRWALG